MGIVRIFSPSSRDIKRFYLQLGAAGITDTCWVWTRAKTRGNYGCFFMGGKLYRAHRASFIIHHGAIPAGFHCLHHCDNPPCVNPNHLFLGSNMDNVQDRVKKGRSNFLPGLLAHIKKNQARQSCRQGHEYTLDSLLLEKNNGKVVRRCRVCRRLRERIGKTNHANF